MDSLPTIEDEQKAAEFASGPLPPEVIDSRWAEIEAYTPPKPVKYRPSLPDWRVKVYYRDGKRRAISPFTGKEIDMEALQAEKDEGRTHTLRREFYGSSWIEPEVYETVIQP